MRAGFDWIVNIFFEGIFVIKDTWTNIKCYRGYLWGLICPFSVISNLMIVLS